MLTVDTAMWNIRTGNDETRLTECAAASAPLRSLSHLPFIPQRSSRRLPVPRQTGEEAPFSKSEIRNPGADGTSSSLPRGNTMNTENSSFFGISTFSCDQSWNCLPNIEPGLRNGVSAERRTPARPHRLQVVRLEKRDSRDGFELRIGRGPDPLQPSYSSWAHPTIRPGHCEGTERSRSS